MPTNLSTKKPLRYKSPRYPTRLEVASDPSLLAEHVPPSWLGRTELAGAMGLLLAVNTGCSDTRPADDHPRRFPDPAYVSPLFEHGDGHGASGCIVVSPPVYLSEEEAIQTISDCLRQNGVDVTPADQSMPGVNVPTWSDEPVQKKDPATGQDIISYEFVVHPEQVKPLVADLQSPDRRIQIEFVSTEDERAFEFDPMEVMRNSKDGSLTSYTLHSSSVHFQRPKHMADHIRSAVRNQGTDVVFAAFYDPLARIEEPAKKNPQEKIDWPALESKATAESKRLLRLQVQDFVNLLKAQGAM